MDAFELNAEQRTASGRAENRRLRKSGRVPGIIYGGDGDPVKVSFNHHELERSFGNDAFFSHIIKIHIDGGKTEEAVLRDMQRHPAKPFIEHLDFLRIVAGEALRMSVPLHFVGEETAPGVEQEGGILQRNLVEVEIECLPRNLPEAIEVDCSQLAVHDTVHLSDLVLPEGVSLVDLMGEEEEQIDQAVVSVQMPQLEPEPADEEAEEAAETTEEEADEAEEGDDEQ